MFETADHSPRLFASDAAVRHVGTGLLSRTLPRPEWTHEGHLAACLWLVRERRDIALEAELPAIIAAYNESVGGVNDDTQGYHETLTQLYIVGVRVFSATCPADAPLVDTVNALLVSDTGSREWPLTLYSHDRLFSVEARRGLVMPDMGVWPAQ